MPVEKTIEITGISTNGWEDAAKEAIKEAAKTVRHISKAELRSEELVIKNDKIEAYRVTLGISFGIEV